MTKLSTIVSAACVLAIAVPQESMAATKSVKDIAKSLGGAYVCPFVPSLIPSLLQMDFSDFNPSIMATGRIETYSLPTGMYEDIIMLAKSLRKAKDPLAVGREFLTHFLKRMNARDHTKLTMHDLCRSIREKIDLAPRDYREACWKAIDAIEFNNPKLLDGIGRYVAASTEDVIKIVAAVIAIICITVITVYNPGFLVAAGAVMFEIINLIFGLKS